MSNDVFKIAEQIKQLDEEISNYRLQIRQNNKMNEEYHRLLDSSEDKMHKLNHELMKSLGIRTDPYDWL